MYADVVSVLRRDLQPGVLHRLFRRGQCEVNKAPHLAGLFFLDELERVEVLDLGGEPDRVAGQVERLDLGHAALAGEQAGPDLGRSVSHATDQSKARYNNTTLFHCFTLPLSG